MKQLVVLSWLLAFGGMAVTFWMYSAFRTLASFGLNLRLALLACAFSAVFTAPIVVFSLVLALRLRPQGACERCGYPLRQSSSSVCPECGQAGPTRFRRRHLPGSFGKELGLRIALIWLAGMVAGEAWVLLDEVAFRHEASHHMVSGAVDGYWRARWWPNRSNALVFSPPDDFHGTD